MRTLVALAVASVLSALLIVASPLLYDAAFKGVSLPGPSRFLETWAVAAVGIAAVYCVIGYPIIALLARFQALRLPIVAAAGAAAASNDGLGPAQVVALTRISVEKRTLFDLRTPFSPPKTPFETGRCFSQRHVFVPEPVGVAKPRAPAPARELTIGFLRPFQVAAPPKGVASFDIES